MMFLIHINCFVGSVDELMGVDGEDGCGDHVRNSHSGF